MLVLAIQYPTLDAAIAEALATFDWPEFAYREVGRTVEDDEALIYVVPYDADGNRIFGIVDVMPALRRNGVWLAALPVDPNYNALRGEVSIPVDTIPFRTNADPDRIPAGYRLPWADGEFATVTRSYDAHGTGRIDFDLTGRNVTAAKAGMVVFAEGRYEVNGPWWYWNAVVIEHRPDEYSLYGHLSGLAPMLADACDPLCEVPVERGQVIGQEGSTGNSTARHLHLELGQAWGTITYPDIRDWDRDGDRFEPVRTAFVYREHNAAFDGYNGAAVAAWPAGQLMQAWHGDPAPIDENLVVNGAFDDETVGWSPSGQLNWRVENGALYATRLRTNAPPNWAALYQNLAYGAAAGADFEVSLRLGNSSAIDKTAEISLRNADGPQYGSVSELVTIPAEADLSPHTVRLTTDSTWATVQVWIGINPADGAPAARIDDVQVHRVQ